MIKLYMYDVTRIFFLFLIIYEGSCSHFRGGTISWKPIHGHTVEFKFKMGWTFGAGPGCDLSKIGQFVNTTFIGDKVWKCVEGCPGVKNPVGTAYYYCTDANNIGGDDEKWEQGENSFQYTFNGEGPFVVSYSGAMWMNLNFGSPNGWNIQTTIDLRYRDDINFPNSSPITASKPLYTLQFACYHDLQLPMYDPDGDKVKCRWARGKECDSVCHAVPSADLDEDTCTLKLNATTSNQYVEDGWYAIALTIEDYPKKSIIVGNEMHNETTPLSQVPLQFLIHVVGRQTPCTWKPEFVSPTPKEGSIISIPTGKTFQQKIYAANLLNNKERVTKLSLTRPAGMTLKGPINDPNRAGVVYWELSWTPTAKDQGSNVVCGMAEDSSGHSSDTRCITLIAWDLPTDPCSSNPCHGNQTCSRIGSTQNIECVCPSGFKLSGQNCLTNQCSSFPCQHGGTCQDDVYGFSCNCITGYTGRQCETDINECATQPCAHKSQCVDIVNGYFCLCPPGYTGRNCATDLDECSSVPCQNGGTCTDLVNSYQCTCPPLFTGVNCQTGFTTIIPTTANANSGSRIAVYAVVDTFPIDVQHNDVIKFEGVKTNVGGAYNPQTGVFTCTVGGYYMFFVNLRIVSHKTAEGELVRNGIPFMRIYDSGNSYDAAGTNMAIIHLNVGDRVWFMLHLRYNDDSGSGGIIDGPWTSFSALLLF